MSGRALQIMWLQRTFSEHKSLRSLNSTKLGLTSVLDNDHHFMSVYLLTSRKIFRFQRNGIICWARSQDCEKRLSASSWPPVRSYGKTRLLVNGFSWNWVFFENLLRKFKFHWSRTWITGTLNDDQYIFLIISRSFLLTMRNVSAKVLKKIKTHFMFSKFFFFENRVLYEITWKNTVQPDRPQMPIWRMRNAWWISKAINTHSTYAILTAFPLQQWLHECASKLRYTYTSCLV